MHCTRRLVEYSGKTSLWLCRHPARQLLVYVVRLLNQRAVNGEVMRLVKVKAHAGDPLNEAADTLASAAAELDPSRSQEVDLEGVYVRCRGTFVPVYEPFRGDGCVQGTGCGPAALPESAVRPSHC